MTTEDGGSEGSAGTGGTPEARGSDIARQALEAARAAASQRPRKPEWRPAGAGQRDRFRAFGWTGAGPDRWDPQPLGALIAGEAKKRGWKPKVDDGTVLGRWREIVGDEIADHAEPVSLDGGVLSVSASSTAWSSQLRLIQSEIIRRIAQAVGHGVVTKLKIQGPKAPSWRKGRLHVSGRGPRDTYG